MKKDFKVLALLGVVVTVMYCTDKKVKTVNTATPVIQQPIKSVLSAEDQAALTPDEIIGRLKKGNENFVSNNLSQRDHSAQRRKAAIGQYPKALVLSCVDSRVPVEDVFDLGIGDIFVARVAGNIENSSIVGSMEFATAVAGSKLIIVLGHTACGAVKHAIDGTDAASLQMNALQALLNDIKPSVVATALNGDASSKNVDFTNRVIKTNVLQTIADIKTASPKLSALSETGSIKIIGAVYNMETGKVDFI
jgi:carbonic anhydrase